MDFDGSVAAGWDQLLKNTDEAPGWAILFLITLVVVEWLPLGTITLANHALSDEVIAGVVTYLAYAAGDVIDAFVFKTKAADEIRTKYFFKRLYEKAANRAEKAYMFVTASTRFRGGWLRQLKRMANLNGSGF
jgi:hypothetical protein